MRLKLISVIILCLFVSGCTAYRSNLEKNKVKISSHVQENNSAARIANEVTKQQLDKTKILVNSANKINGGFTLTDTNYFQVGMSLDLGSRAAELTGGFLERNENLIGKPAEDQNEIIKNLLSENQLLRIGAEREQKSKLSKEEELINENRELTDKLVSYGTKYEEERNARITFWTKWITILGIGIGGLVALCVFVPAVIPLIISIFPKAISFFGVVGSKTVNAIVKGLGESRYSLKERIKITEEQKAKDPNFQEDKWTAAEVLELIDNELSKATSDKDKEIIQTLRNKLNI